MTSLTLRLSGYLKQLTAEIVGNQALQDEGRREVLTAQQPEDSGLVPQADDAAVAVDGQLRKRLPVATYRLQLRNGMDFDKAGGLIPYFRQLGVSHLYLSPVFKAVAGSEHGYDVVDMNMIEPAIGGHDAFDRFVKQAHEAGLSVILDIVPNHMAASPQNDWWFSVLEWGQASPYATHFDITWTDKLSLPFLAKPVLDLVENGELRLIYDRQRSALCLGWPGMALPLAPASYKLVLESLDRPVAREILALAVQMPAASAQMLHSEIARLLSQDDAADWLEQQLDALSANPRLIETIYEKQHWRLTENGDRNYRRFFDVSGLVGLRVEDPRVFEDSHRLVLDLVRQGKIDGVRVDHVDGLAEPENYLERLRTQAGRDAYIIVEKILMNTESLPETWAIDGDTGYGFISTLGNAFTDPDGLSILTNKHQELLDYATGPTAQLHDAKRQVIVEFFTNELTDLTNLAHQISEMDNPEHAIPKAELAEAIEALLIAMPVYRTYSGEKHASALVGTRKALSAVSEDKTHSVRVLDFLQNALASDAEEDSDGLRALLRTRFEQCSSAVMAKSMEDTLFYRYTAFPALNEVGDNPAWQERSLAAFHQRMEEAANGKRHGLAATSTHDTKFSEDARARLFTISEAPEEWHKAVAGWSAQNARFAKTVDGKTVPGPRETWLVYVSLAALWPADRRPPADIAEALKPRLSRHLMKALREAKLDTSWIDINTEYEAAIQDYVQHVLARKNDAFLGTFAEDLAPFIEAGLLNSLTQLVIKMTSPAVPDIYQGCESLAFSLVDPDNRHAVDFDRLAANLNTLPDRMTDREALFDGRLKMFLTAKCLHLRRENKVLFESGGYSALEINGPCSRNVIAFERRLANGQAMLVIAPRLSFGRTRETFPPIPAESWQETSVRLTRPGLVYRDMISGETHTLTGEVPLNRILSAYPVSILMET
ncbi:malto-oligosyltrehalose synthase [Rhizobium sp. L1K21]|uniref:malto-oligosyltrehalose synthase n=1 Tax=Rhizobium sp. L1K21 TaxID=2954933 RepID=UPI002093F7D2|nr:malto-oligosyltrehalose synthase [Rhizobium sp. L1K21]MCO6187798.1 malto-oligosyltrehalose synthase [Rhizobium sp. L1K21]